MTATTSMPTIDLSRDALLSDSALSFFQHYMHPDETSPQQLLMRAAVRHTSTPEEAQRLYDAVSRGHLAFSSSHLRNA